MRCGGGYMTPLEGRAGNDVPTLARSLRSFTERRVRYGNERRNEPSASASQSRASVGPVIGRCKHWGFAWWRCMLPS